MIIDKILDRKDGQPYYPEKFRRDCEKYGEVGRDIVNALYESDVAVKIALCKYIHDNDYSYAVCDYISSVNWLEPDAGIVACDDYCGAKEEPQTYEEALATVAHYKSHSYLSGCSHAN
jgi:hypothetical protein